MKDTNTVGTQPEPVVQREMPRYTKTIRVWALKITSVEYRPPSGCRPQDHMWLTFEDKNYAPLQVHEPEDFNHSGEEVQAGGYYVVSGDTCRSTYVPAHAFESQYVPVKPVG